MRSLLVCALALAACGHPRPVHPMRLAGYHGAPIAESLFPMRPASWVFEERLAGEGGTLVLELSGDAPAMRLTGRTEAALEVRREGTFLEILRDGEVVDRLLLEGKVGDRWSLPGGSGDVFGYDEIEVLGEKRRALVLAATREDRGALLRDLCWLVPGIGWARIRTERDGRPVRDAWLVEHRASIDERADDG